MAGALIACTTIAQIANIFVFCVARRAARGHNFGLRTILAAGVAALFGWSAFIIVLGIAQELTDDAMAVAGAACLYMAAAAIVLAIPLAVVRGWLRTFVRVGRFEDELVERNSFEMPVAEEYTFQPTLHPFTTGEMEFFAEGEVLARAETLADDYA